VLTPNKGVSEMSTKATEWLEWLTKASLPVVTAAVIGMYVQTERLTVMMNSQAKELSELKTEITAIKAGFVSRIELIETIKRIDTQIEMILRAL
jgi:hypothetical protein